MSEKLLALRVGPVQRFISAARRTRDLWFGSQILSEAAAAAADALRRGGATLIVPPGTSGDSDVNRSGCPNVLIVSISTAYLNTAVDAAHRAAHEVWKKRACMAFERAKSLVDADLWWEQVGKQYEQEFFEITQVNVDRSSDHGTDLKQLMSRLAVAKLTRKFTQLKDTSRAPKSSLDGRGSSVLAPKGLNKLDSESSLYSLLRITDKENPAKIEHLDAVGLVKRAGSDRRFPSVRIVAEDLVEQFELKKDSDEFDDESAGGNYYAIVLADGDDTGALLGKICTIEDHQSHSSRLQDFASKAGTVAKDHRGVIVYAAGEDVLALIPSVRAVDFAADLAKCYSLKVQATLSVGLALVHSMEPLEDALNYARSALENAKSYCALDVHGVALLGHRKNALAIHAHPRSGAPIKRVYSWLDKPEEFLSSLIEAFLVRSVPDRMPYRLGSIAKAYRGWSRQSVGYEMARLELTRQWDKRELEQTLTNDARHQIDIRTEHYRKTGQAAHDLIDHFSKDLRVARFIARGPDER